MGLNMRSEGHLNRTTILWPGIPKWGWQNRIISCQCDIHCDLLVLHSFDRPFRSDLSMWPTVDHWVQRKRQSVYEASGLCPKKEKSIAGRKATINWSINVYTLWPERQIIINRVQESSSSESSFNWALLQILDCPFLNWVDSSFSLSSGYSRIYEEWRSRNGQLASGPEFQVVPFITSVRGRML